MSDFGDDEFPNMLCVEAGNVSAPVILLPGGVFEASQILQVFACIFPYFPEFKTLTESINSKKNVIKIRLHLNL